MSGKLIDFHQTKIKNFFGAIVNCIIFLPYFFSVNSLLKNLFLPWKNITTQKTSVGFSLQEWISIQSFNLISRTIGLMIRISFLVLFLITESLFLLLLPIIFGVYILILPFLFLFSFFKKTQEEHKQELKSIFIKNHLQKQENYLKVNQWFEDYYQTKYINNQWWQLINLLSIPPISKNLTMGYTPTLDQFSNELTTNNYQSKTTNIVNRNKEIKQIETTLSKSNQVNILIVGDEGVGKHTIVDALSRRVYHGKTNLLLKYKRILKLDMEKILSQFSDLKKKEYFLEELFLEALKAKNIILFIDNIHLYLTNSLKSEINITPIIEKYAKSPQLQIIGITTPFYFQKYINPNEKIIKLFNKIDVFEVNKKEAEQILLNVALLFEKRYKVIIPYETIQNLITKSNYYITAIPFPEKAFDLLDLACAFKLKNKNNTIITPDLIDYVLTQKTHIPTVLNQTLKDKLIHLEKLLSEKIVGQNEAINQLSSAIRRSFILLGKRKKPLASFLFFGPSGIGKTETAKSLAEVFFNSRNKIIRIDMSFYQTKNDIVKLIGSLETKDPGILTSAVRNNPYGILLIDEIEKADKDLLNIFLTILDEGYFIDGFGKRVDCKNLIIIATSNAANNIISQMDQKNTSKNLINYLIENKIFLAEFLNRFDGVIAYKLLNPQSTSDIAKKKINQIIKEIYDLHQIKIKVSNQLINQIINQEVNNQFGARDLDRIIREKIEDKLAKLILENKVKKGETIELN